MIRQELMVELNKIETMEELKEVIYYVRDMGSELIRNREISAGQQFRVGDRVKFVSKKRNGSGGLIVGTIIKKNAMTCKVKADSGIIWSVSSSLLDKA